MGSPLEDLLGGLGKGGGGGGGPLAALTGGGGGGGAGLLSKLLPALSGLLAGGGLSKLLGGFKAQGLTSQADSWVGKGDNEPVTGDQVRQALGDQEVSRIASEIGLPENETADVLAQALPAAVDKATPEGELPDAQTVDRRLGLS